MLFSLGHNDFYLGYNDNQFIGKNKSCMNNVIFYWYLLKFVYINKGLQISNYDHLTVFWRQINRWQQESTYLNLTFKLLGLIFQINVVMKARQISTNESKEFKKVWIWLSILAVEFCGKFRWLFLNIICAIRNQYVCCNY